MTIIQLPSAPQLRSHYMQGVYGAGKVCPFDNQSCNLNTEGLTLEPGISEVIDNPADHTWEELSYYWKEWRNVSGKQIRQEFASYVELSNKAAVANSLSDASQMWLSSYNQDDPQFRWEFVIIGRETSISKHFGRQSCHSAQLLAGLKIKTNSMCSHVIFIVFY